MPVSNSNEIISLINQLQNYFKNIIATKDWHCKNHVSFSNNKNGGIWPEHCVKNTWGSEFPNDLNTKRIKKFFLKEPINITIVTVDFMMIALKKTNGPSALSEKQFNQYIIYNGTSIGFLCKRNNT